MATSNDWVEEYEWTVWHDGKVQKIKDSEYRILQSLMFLEIWNERAHECEVSKERLYDARNFYFHHILEKRNYELYSLCKWNIIMLTWGVHDAYERNPLTYPMIHQMKQDLITQINSDGFRFDRDITWGTSTKRCQVDAALGTTIKERGQI